MLRRLLAGQARLLVLSDARLQAFEADASVMAPLGEVEQLGFQMLGLLLGQPTLRRRLGLRPPRFIQRPLRRGQFRRQALPR